MTESIATMTARAIPGPNQALSGPCWVCGSNLPPGAAFRVCSACTPPGGFTAAECIAVGRISDRGQGVRDVIAARRRRPAAEPTPGAPEAFAYAIAEGEVAAWAKTSTHALLVLHGPTGTGKTHQAWGAIRALRLPAQGVKAAGLHRVERAEIQAMVGIDVLLLDDLASRTSPGALATALEVIDLRTEHRRRTIVTTNASFTDLAALEPRLASRLAGGRIVKLAGRDRRLGGA